MELKLSVLIADFLLDRSAQGRSPATLDFYRGHLKMFLADVGDIPMADLERSRVRAWLASKREKAPQGAAAYWRTLRAFFNYCRREGYTKTDMTTGIKMRDNPPAIESLTTDEIAVLLEASRSGPYPARGAALLRLWLDTGLRPSEMMGLKLEHVDMQSWLITLTRSKTGPGRIVPFGAKAAKAVHRYLSGERNHLNQRQQPSLWIGRKGAPLGQFGAARYLEGLAKDSNLQRSVYPYLFRHTFARLYLLAGGDPYALNRIMGHSSMKVTLRYVNFYKSEIAGLYNRVSPGDQF